MSVPEGFRVLRLHGDMLATLGDTLLTIGGNLRAGTARFLPTINLASGMLTITGEPDSRFSADRWFE